MPFGYLEENLKFDPKRHDRNPRRFFIVLLKYRRRYFGDVAMCLVGITNCLRKRQFYFYEAFEFNSVFMIGEILNK